MNIQARRGVKTLTTGRKVIEHNAEGKTAEHSIRRV